ncbi:MAG: hypothetical protein MJY47_00780, partial [Fibrobacter sp.]|nr:hypothetical protein [Fibrobacter sp.]
GNFARPIGKLFSFFLLFFAKNWIKTACFQLHSSLSTFYEHEFFVRFLGIAINRILFSLIRENEQRYP